MSKGSVRRRALVTPREEELRYIAAMQRELTRAEMTELNKLIKARMDEQHRQINSYRRIV